ANNSISGHSGTLHGGVGYTRGIAGNGFSFDGKDSFIDLGHEAGNFGTNDFTIDYWVKNDPIPDSISTEAFLEEKLVCDMHEKNEGWLMLHGAGNGLQTFDCGGPNLTN